MDILINYRKKYNGETPRTTLESLRYGIININIVRKIGWFDELSDDLVVKVSNFNQINNIIEKLIKDPEKLYKKRISIFKKSNKLFDNKKILLKVNHLLKNLANYNNPNYKIRNYLINNDLENIDINEIIKFFIKARE